MKQRSRLGYVCGVFIIVSLVLPSHIFASIPSSLTLLEQFVKTKRSLASAIFKHQVVVRKKGFDKPLIGTQWTIVRFPNKGAAPAIQVIRQFKSFRWIELAFNNKRVVFYRNQAKQVQSGMADLLEPPYSFLDSMLLSYSSEEVAGHLKALGIQPGEVVHEYINRQLFFLVGAFGSAIPENGTLLLERGTGKDFSDYFSDRPFKGQILLEKPDHDRKNNRPLRPHSAVFKLNNSLFVEIFEYDALEMQTGRQRAYFPWYPNRYHFFRGDDFSYDLELTSIDVNTPLGEHPFESRALQEKTRLGPKDQGRADKILDLLDELFRSL